jgi:hypothetical protein
MRRADRENLDAENPVDSLNDFLNPRLNFAFVLEIGDPRHSRKKFLEKLDPSS